MISKLPFRSTFGRFTLGAALVALAATPLLLAGLRTEAGGVGPDVTVHTLTGPGNSYPAVGAFRSYSLGTVSCNQGDVPLNWCDNNGGCPGQGTTSAQHPVIAQNLYRLKDGRFEQIGMSWLKHGFTALANSDAACGDGSCANPGTGNLLGVGCTDPYSSGLNGGTPLGMRSEVNATTGVFPFPKTDVPTVDQTSQRMRVALVDLDPALNTGASYWAEGQYVAADDAAAGNGLNNASYHRVTVGASPFNLSYSGSIVRTRPAIYAWPAQDPTVTLVEVDVAGGIVQRFHVARKVTDLGAGLWHYEYAIHNLNSDRSANSFSVTFPAATNFTNVGFKDIEHHSGEPYATTDWDDSATATTLTWSTDDFATDPNANALRWATLFNFWFDADRGPDGTLGHSIGLFKPGSPSSADFDLVVNLFEDGFESGDTSGWSATVP